MIWSSAQRVFRPDYPPGGHDLSDHEKSLSIDLSAEHPTQTLHPLRAFTDLKKEGENVFISRSYDHRENKRSHCWQIAPKRGQCNEDDFKSAHTGCGLDEGNYEQRVTIFPN